MKLKKLLSAVPLITLYRGNKEISITGLTAHSKYVIPGSLFVAKSGSADDGNKYIEEAVASGAAAILTENPNPFLKNVVQLTTPSIRAVEGKLASAYYSEPSKEIFTIGVTGTSGKTTVTTLIKHLLDHLSLPCGLLGTVESVVGNQRRAPLNTTLDVLSNHKMLREMKNAGCLSASLEVSSHGLAQGRVDEIDFKIAVFTNLTHEHLDYHGTMENYADAKSQLFSNLSPKSIAIVNLDDPWTDKMIKHCRSKILTFGFSSKADVVGAIKSLDAFGTVFEVSFKGQTLRFSWSLIGKHNVSNALGAIASVLSMGIPFEKLVPLIQSFSPPRGRLERVNSSSVFVDYAHKPDALEKVLLSLFEIKKGRLITIFGCGGDRDAQKRPFMAQVAEKYSDYTIVTTDNPRTEDPGTIIQAIVAGFCKSNYCVEPDRKNAIAKAIRMKEAQDIVLIAGKGHETYQIFAHQTIAFDDKEIAEEILKV
jgi:UDP-N-acetylmuramoyl-L-alanyl-D-glutamate--2,6-diaminopimelate ligase